MATIDFINNKEERKTVVFGKQLQDGGGAITNLCTIDGISYIIKNIKLGIVTIEEIQQQFAIEAALVGRLSTCSNPAVGIACFKGILIGSRTSTSTIANVLEYIRSNNASVLDLINSFSGIGVYLLYEYVTGHELLDFAGLVRPKQSIEIMLEIFKIIQSLHQIGIVHLDIKPENIMMRDDKTPVLIDFDSTCDIGSCRITQFMGTSLYCAPEMYRFASNPITVLPPLDIYSAGMTMFTFFVADFFAARLRDPLINAHPLWDTKEKSIRKILKFSNPAAAPMDTVEIKKLFNDKGYSDELWDLFLRMIHPDPTRRPTADDIVAILTRVVGGSVAAASVSPVVVAPLPASFASPLATAKVNTEPSKVATGLAPRPGCGIFGCFGRGGRRTRGRCRTNKGGHTRKNKRH